MPALLVLRSSSRKVFSSSNSVEEARLSRVASYSGWRALNRSVAERQRASKGGECPRDGKTSGFWPLGGKWIAFTVGIVRNRSGLLSSGRRFGTVRLGKLAIWEMSSQQRNTKMTWETITRELTPEEPGLCRLMS